MQGTNVSTSQLYRIRNYFVGCWIAEGWSTCARLLVRGDRSVTCIEQQQDTVRGITDPNPNNRETDMSINCRMWTTMRDVSRTHRVALDWLFDRISLDPKIRTKFVDTKNQLADMLTKGSFSRDEWNHLLRLLNIMNFSIFSCSHFLPSLFG